MSEFTISATVRIKDHRDPEILDNSIQIISIDKMIDTKLSITEKDKLKKTDLNYSNILNGYVCDKYMILYIKKKWVYIFNSPSKRDVIYYFYNNSDRPDTVNLRGISELFTSSKITFWKNNTEINEKTSEFNDICVYFEVGSGKRSMSELQKILNGYTISFSSS
jgi:hypothetical protein